MKKKRAEEKPIAPSFIATGFLVVKDAQLCTIENVSGKRKGGVLRPADVETDTIAHFLKRRDARRAIERTENCSAELRGSMIEDWARERAPFLFVAGKFSVLALGRQA
ncbi:MAG: hypothetical protein HZA93_13085 [Verrucomicrobia bacterium]|nr:hypothetical protein [Verrucomicrobiota bacterium]